MLQKVGVPFSAGCYHGVVINALFHTIQGAFLRDAKDAPWVFVLFSVLILMVACVISWADGMSDHDLTRTFLGDSFTVLALIHASLMAFTAFPVILCSLSEPARPRLVMETFTASIVSSLSRLLESLGRRTTAQPVLAALGDVRLAVRPQMSIPELGFFPGASPQLE